MSELTGHTKRLRITLAGCDDSTTVEIDCTEAESAFVHRLAGEVSLASTYGCMPTLRVATLSDDLVSGETK